MGDVIVHGHVSITILLQACRSVVPLILIIALPAAPLWVVTCSITVGELTRLIGLSVILQRIIKTNSLTTDEASGISSNGLWWQASSMATSQAGSVTDRAFLGAAPAGSVAAYEMSDKILYAGVQVLVSGLLLRRVAGWARAAESTAGEFMRILRIQLSGIIGIAVLAAAVAVISLELVIHSRFVDPAWEVGLRWGQVAVLSMPLSVLMTALGRVLVVLRSQQFLLPLVLIGLASNLILNIVFFIPFGGFGILLSSVVSRFVGSVSYLVVVWLLIKKHKTDDLGRAVA